VETRRNAVILVVALVMVSAGACVAVRCGSGAAEVVVVNCLALVRVVF